MSDVSICVCTYIITYWKYWGHIKLGSLQFIRNHVFSYSQLDNNLNVKTYTSIAVYERDSSMLSKDIS